MSVFQFETCLDSLDESHGVARSALHLVTQWRRKIIVLYIPKVIFFRDKLRRNLVGGLVLFGPRLSVGIRFNEIISVFAKLFGARRWGFDKLFHVL